MQLTTNADPVQQLRAAFVAAPIPPQIGVAVSGGSDSIALLHLLVDWSRDGGPAVHAVTVDHGLRVDAAAEARAVDQICAGLGVPHDTLRWQGHDGTGNLMDAARRARYRLIADWARGQGIAVIALGHTADDQAETFLLRLARGSGVDGLSGMAVWRQSQGQAWVRPLLGAGRDELRAFLVRRGIGWIDDPTNADAHYDRVKARQALAVLAPLGITRQRLVDTAARMVLARRALDETAMRAARDAARIEAGDVVLRREVLLAQPEEIRLRLLAQAIRWLTSADYRPRLRPLSAALAQMTQGRRVTLAGCLLSGGRTEFRIGREPRAAMAAVSVPGAVWDGRWRVEGPEISGLQVRALGEAGLAQCAHWRATGLPRMTLLASPAVWKGEVLVAAPLARAEADWRAVPAIDAQRFFLSALSH